MACLYCVDACRQTVFVGRTGRQRVAVGAQRNRVAEEFVGAGALRTGGLDVGLLRPAVAGASEHIHGSRVAGRVVRLVAVDSAIRAVLANRAGRERVSIVAESEG